MSDPRLDQHLVAHDAFALAFALACGVIGGAVQQAWEVGVLTAGATLTLGILALRVRLLRRGMNKLALAVEKLVLARVKPALEGHK